MTAPGLQTVRGHCDPRFQRVREEFDRNFAERGESGASLCVFVDGEPVIDLWGGVADERTGRPWERDTLNVVFSCTKGLTAICGNLLVDRGLLDLDAPVARYWPEFGQQGKAAIPVRMLFNHQSGVCHVAEQVPRRGFNDWQQMVGMLERTPPFWTPGTRAGYHGMTFGWLIGELVRRVTGKSIGTFFREEIAEPLGLDAWIGLPAAHEPRVAKSIPFDLGLPRPPAWVPLEAAARLIKSTPPLRRAATRRFERALAAKGLPVELAAAAVETLGSLRYRIATNSGDWLPETFDEPAGHAAEIPAGGAVANARGLAGAYAPFSLGGAMRGVRFVGEATLAGMRTVQSAQAIDAVIGVPTTYTLGFSKSWRPVRGSGVVIGEDAFGTPGLGGQMGFADPSFRLAFGYTMTKHGLGTALNARAQSLIDATYRVLGSPGCEPGFWIRPR